MMGNNFSLLIKKEIVDNKKPILLGLTGIWATFIIMGAFLGYIGGYIPLEIILFLFFSSMILTIGASLSFSNMKTKGGRINNLMLPATTFQKYVVRWIGMVPLLLVVVFIGALLGDAVRLGVYHLTPVHYINTDDVVTSTDKNLLSYIMCELRDDMKAVSFLICISIIGLLTAQAIYFLGAILWPRLSFIKTWAVMQVVQVVIVTCLFIIAPHRILMQLEIIDNFSTFLTIIIVSGLLFCALLYWLAYIRYRKSQVIYKLF